MSCFESLVIFQRGLDLSQAKRMLELSIEKQQKLLFVQASNVTKNLTLLLMSLERIN